MESQESFVSFKRVDEFWDRKRDPISRSALAELENRYSIHLPESLVSLYLISNGGGTDFIYFSKGVECFSLFPEGKIFPLEEWESVESFIQGFLIDDEDMLFSTRQCSQARIMYRYGFEYFVLFIPSEDGAGGWIGQLDLATAPGEEARVRIVCRAEELAPGLRKKAGD